MAATGIRSGEALGLQVECAHLDDEIPWLEIKHSHDRKALKGIKTNKCRKVPLISFLAETLRENIPLSGYVLSEADGTTVMRYSTLRYALDEALEQIGLPPSEIKRRKLSAHSL